MPFLSVLCTVRDEVQIVEWVEYHRLVGVDQFYLIDNGSAQPLVDVLAPQIAEGLVTVLPLPSWFVQPMAGPQHLRLLQEASELVRDKTSWLAIIDADEFLVPNGQHDRVSTWLMSEGYCPHVGGFVLPWLVFGSNGWVIRPPRMTTGYTRRAAVCPWDPRYGNNWVKTIVRTDVLGHVASAHWCAYREGFRAMLPDGSPHTWLNDQPATTSRLVTSPVQLNHYFLRSRQDWLCKMAQSVEGTHRSIDMFDKFDLVCHEVEDLTLVNRYGARLEHRLKMLGV